jgi:ribonuclease-3
MEKDLSVLEKKLGLSFRNTALLKEALTHRSFLNEITSWSVTHNERLEYLGDAVLELIVSEHLFEAFPEREEGDLTAIRAALVNTQSLSLVARGMGLDEWIFLSRGEARDSGKAREAILANGFEALLGAVYLDKGYEEAKKFTEKFLFPALTPIMAEKRYIDPKSLLQETVQETLKVTPAYKVLSEQGPDHQKRFFVGVFFGETLAAQGEGLSKQEAEVQAARAALEFLEKKESV